MSAILSSVMCDELVTLMGKQEMDVIISRFRNSRSYSISLDSTPNVDQLTLILGAPTKTVPMASKFVDPALIVIVYFKDVKPIKFRR